MNSVWLSLLWKEWCEFRWKLVALTVSFVIGQAILASVFINDHWRNVAAVIVQSTALCLAAYTILAGMFVGMSVAAGESSNRTMRFTQALPIPIWQAAAVRIVVGLFTIVVPILCLMLFVWAFTSYLWGDQLRDDLNNLRHLWIPSNFFADKTLSAILGVGSLLLWTSACGVNRSDEVRAGAIAFLVCAVLWGVWISAMEKTQDIELRSVLEVMTVALPGGPAFGGEFNYTGHPKNYPLLGIIAITSHILLLGYFVVQYGRSTGKSYTGGKQFITDWFRFRGPSQPFRSQSIAIMWKQVRELGPLALMAVGGILAVMAFTYVADDPLRWTNHDWRSMLGGLTLTVGGFVTVVSGLGMIYEDYSRGLPNFWRSRPINLHQWFVLKYLTGILILVMAFVPLLLIAGKGETWNMDTMLDVAIFVMIYLALYTGSLAAYALVRQPIYAVILAIFSIWAVVALAYGIHSWLPIDPDYLIAIAFTFVVFLATILAWQAVVRDWGWKRYR